jgi:hypothetical protein
MINNDPYRYVLQLRIILPYLPKFGFQILANSLDQDFSPKPRYPYYDGTVPGKLYVLTSSVSYSLSIKVPPEDTEYGSHPRPHGRETPDKLDCPSRTIPCRKIFLI